MSWLEKIPQKIKRAVGAAQRKMCQKAFGVSASRA